MSQMQSRLTARNACRRSSVVVAQRTALCADFVALATSGLYPDGQGLATFENDLLAAVAASKTAGNNGTLTAAETSMLQTELGTALSHDRGGLYGDGGGVGGDAANLAAASVSSLVVPGFSGSLAPC